MAVLNRTLPVRHSPKLFLRNLLQEDRLLHCVLEVFALDVFDVPLSLGCVRDNRFEPGNILGVQLPPGGV